MRRKSKLAGSIATTTPSVGVGTFTAQPAVAASSAFGAETVHYLLQVDYGRGLTTDLAMAGDYLVRMRLRHCRLRPLGADISTAGPVTSGNAAASLSR